MIRIAISPAAFDAIAATLPLGSVAYEAEVNERGERLIWLEAAMVDRLGAMRGPGESTATSSFGWWRIKTRSEQSPHDPEPRTTRPNSSGAHASGLRDRRGTAVVAR